MPVGGSAEESYRNAGLWFGVMGAILIALVVLGLVPSRDDKPSTPKVPGASESIISGTQNGVWDKIPAECKTELAPVGTVAGCSFERLTADELDLITCASEDGPGPCFWTDRPTGQIWYVAGSR